MRVSYVIRVTDEDKKTVKEEDRPEKIREKFRIFCGAVADDSFIDGIDQEFIDKHVEPFYDKVFAGVSETPVYKNVNGAVDPKEIFRIAAAALFKKGFTTLPTTGLIIAGYGQSDYFPQLSHYTCYGIFLGKILCVKNTSDTTDISHNNVSEIKDFAQSEMVKTFIYGASIEALVEIDRIFVKTVDAYTDALVKAGHLKAGLDLEDAKVAAKTNFSTQTSSYLSTEHSRPLRNVIGIAQPAFLRPKRALKGALKWTEKRFWKRSKRPLVSLCQMRVLSAPGAIGPATMRKTAITPAARTPGTERISRLY